MKKSTTPCNPDSLVVYFPSRLMLPQRIIIEPRAQGGDFARHAIRAFIHMRGYIFKSPQHTAAPGMHRRVERTNTGDKVPP